MSERCCAFALSFLMASLEWKKIPVAANRNGSGGGGSKARDERVSEARRGGFMVKP